MNVRDIQKLLANSGYDPGGIDGDLGPKTYAAMFGFMARRALLDVGRDLGVGADMYFPAHGITTPLRIGHFLAQTCHESGGYRYFNEIWGPTAAQSRYEGRLDLGNHTQGDGHRFAGRGILQITGRANYEACGRRCGLNLIDAPELAARPDIAVRIACDYWGTHKVNQAADADDVEHVTRLVNGGLNGLAERKALTARARIILGSGS